MSTPDCSWPSRKLAEVNENPGNHPEYVVENGQLYRNFPKNRLDEDGTHWMLCAAKPDRLRVLQQNHDHPTAGHLGIRKTIARVTNRYFWPGMFREIGRYGRKYQQCQRFKSTQQGKMLTHIPEEPWSSVCVDFVGPLPRSKHGNTMLLVFQDKFSKWVELIPLRSATTEGVVRALRTNISSKFGAPKMLKSDNGTQFANRLLAKTLEERGIKHQFTAPYTIQENAVERANRTIKTMMAQYAEENQRTWDELQPEFTLAINTGISETTGLSPAYIVQGRELRLPGTGQPEEDPTEKSTRLHETFRLVRHSLQQASQNQDRQYNLHRRDRKPEIGDLVWIKERHLSKAIDGFAAKLATK